MGYAGLTTRRSLLLLCESLMHSNYCLWADNLFVSMTTISAWYQMPQKVCLSGTARKDAAGYPSILNQHSLASKKDFSSATGEYEALHTRVPPESVAVLWMNSEKTRFLGSSSDSTESELRRRQRSNSSSQGKVMESKSD